MLTVLIRAGNNNKVQPMDGAEDEEDGNRLCSLLYRSLWFGSKAGGSERLNYLIQLPFHTGQIRDHRTLTADHHQGIVGRIFRHFFAAQLFREHPHQTG